MSFSPSKGATAYAADAHPQPEPLDAGALRIGIIAPSRSPIAEPFAGGLEAHVWCATQALRARGHDVTLFAAPGSDPELKPVELELSTTWLSLDARRDVSMQPDLVVGDHHAYLTLMTRIGGEYDLDLVQNHSLHYLPVVMADAVCVPVVTTLHTPPTPWLESAARIGAASRRTHFVAVSEHTARAWQHVAGAVPVIRNGVDLDRWPVGRGGDCAVWSGRIAPEKGVHLAIDACRLAGLSVDVCGPVVDRRYFDEQIRTRLARDVRYLGHLDQPSLSEVVRNAAVAVVTPDWDEPYGLVVAEAFASGTPVAAFARGGVPEIVDEHCARLARPGDLAALAATIREAATLDRTAARQRAERHCSVDAMISNYEAHWRLLLAGEPT